ncbi:MAG: ArsR family transcriptional regulator [Methanocalculus sp. MSAO_Arc1]|uniref:ArsR/SmtB family transcription factor n=1 Tax=Methanocalculus TaxID=71151 RepID=UPI000FF4F1AD|nr:MULTISPECIES: metalloregulator ArsR/SmtB family transcription factor [unclassified Methanocalculus]MCP1662952.1 ArsR family transcriptional regulator [Methanocalculus sp. AMF5]RQD81474.1 MAG: ArsR family transcriptional regulator [Methanocalculus sp. MSAO_Arc1]
MAGAPDDELSGKALLGKNCAIPPDVEASLAASGGLQGLQGLLAHLPEDAEALAAASLFRALADPFRLKILALLAVQPLCVCVIRLILGISDSRLSYHLSILKKAGFIAGDQSGTWIIYRLTEEGERVKGLVAWGEE